MDLVLLGYQLVFFHKPSLLPTVHLLSYPRRGDGKKKKGFEKSIKIVSGAYFIKIVSIFPDSTGDYRIRYYQCTHDFSSILKSIIFV
jgi:hypothetical protein